MSLTILHAASTISIESLGEETLCTDVSLGLQVRIGRETMKTAYLDIETSYDGTFTDQRLFKDYKHHRITVIGVRILDGESDAFIQLVGNDVTRANLMLVLKGVERLVTYNGRSIPDKVKGYVGFDFPVIAAQLGVVLDQEFAHVDLCPECWRKGLWGGLKVVEQILGLKRKLAGQRRQMGRRNVEEI